MNPIKYAVALMVLVGLTAGPAHAISVFDASNFTQNLLTATRTLQQVNNQIHQLQNEALMLQNQARNLRSLDYNALNDLRVALAATDRLTPKPAVWRLRSPRWKRAAALYPDRYDPNLPGARLLTDAREHWRNSLEALRTAVRVQAQVQENFRTDESVLGDLVTRSQGAAGALEAAQAGNQLLALSIRQQLQAQQLAISEGRAVATESARTVAAAERARPCARFLGNGTRYTPVTVEMFAQPSLTRTHPVIPMDNLGVIDRFLAIHQYIDSGFDCWAGGGLFDRHPGALDVTSLGCSGRWGTDDVIVSS